MTINYKTFDPKNLDAIEIDGIDRNDAPDFCDAYVVSADYDGVELTPDELETMFEEWLPGLEAELVQEYMN